MEGNERKGDRSRFYYENIFIQTAIFQRLFKLDTFKLYFETIFNQPINFLNLCIQYTLRHIKIDYPILISDQFSDCISFNIWLWWRFTGSKLFSVIAYAKLAFAVLCEDDSDNGNKMLNKIDHLISFSCQLCVIISNWVNQRIVSVVT